MVQNERQQHFDDWRARLTRAWKEALGRSTQRLPHRHMEIKQCFWLQQRQPFSCSIFNDQVFLKNHILLFLPFLVFYLAVAAQPKAIVNLPAAEAEAMRASGPFKQPFSALSKIHPYYSSSGCSITHPNTCSSAAPLTQTKPWVASQTDVVPRNSVKQVLLFCFLNLLWHFQKVAHFVQWYLLMLDDIKCLPKCYAWVQRWCLLLLQIKGCFLKDWPFLLFLHLQ